MNTRRCAKARPDPFARSWCGKGCAEEAEWESDRPFTSRTFPTLCSQGQAVACLRQPAARYSTGFVTVSPIDSGAGAKYGPADATARLYAVLPRCSASEMPHIPTSPVSATWNYLSDRQRSRHYRFCDASKNGITHFLEAPYRYSATSCHPTRRSDGCGQLAQPRYGFCCGVKGGSGGGWLNTGTAGMPIPGRNQHHQSPDHAVGSKRRETYAAPFGFENQR